MNDLISRQAAIEVADAVWVVTGDKNVAKVWDQIKDLPSAEPEIIRCRDCKYAHLTYDGDCKQCDKWLDDDDIHLTLYLDGDFYCGYAERRNNG